MKWRKYYYLIICLMLTACGEADKITAPVTIVAFGDSLTAGYRLPIEKAFPAQLEQRFHAEGHSGVRVINMGTSGDKTEDGLRKVEKVIALAPDIVILELGANDILGQLPARKARQNLSRIIEQLQEENIDVLLTGIQPPNLFLISNQRAGEYNALFEELADQYGLRLYPNFLQDVHGKSDLNLPDGLHPNAQGISVIAEGIYPQVLEMAQEVH